MSIQPSSAMDSTADLVDGVKQKKDFPLKFCTVCASNQNRFVPLPSFFFSSSFPSPSFFFFFPFVCVIHQRWRFRPGRIICLGFFIVPSRRDFFLSFFLSFLYRVMRGKDEARIDGQKSFHDDISSRDYHRAMMFLHMISQSARPLCRARYKIDSSAMTRKTRLFPPSLPPPPVGRVIQAGGGRGGGFCSVEKPMRAQPSSYYISIKMHTMNTNRAPLSPL